ncbi:hypothetical protein ACIA6D_24135 [Streptomyces cacaoi]|uniref:hypothetical protein n=1 Tax=Streptomyces cacaoi TaxID=1898 RepID=UPI0037494C1A
MTENTPERPETAPAPAIPAPAARPAFPTMPSTAPPPPAAVPQRPARKRALIATAAVAVLLVGGGVTWWALADGDNAMSHVEVSGGKLTESENSLLDEGEECDDTDEFTYNDCDADTAYEFIYEITNKGDEPANYAVIVNGFDEDGDFVGQAFVSTTHLRPGKTDADTGEFDEYAELEGDHTLSDIDSVKVAHVERVALAN